MQQPLSMEGGVFHADIPTGRSAAQFSIVENTLEAHTSTGQVFHVPLEGLSLSMGGHQNKTLFAKHPTLAITLFAQVEVFLPWLRTHGSHVLQHALHACDETHKKQVQKKRFGWMFFALFLAAVFFSVRTCVRQSPYGMARYVPLSVDKEVGALAYDQIISQGTVLKKPLVSEAVQKILKTLQPHAHAKDFQFKLTVVKSDTVNAFALPGGYIVVFSGLLSKATSPELVAGVLAHEIAHVTQRHSVQQWIKSLGVIGVAQILMGDVVGLIAFGKELATSLALSNYSRTHESDADAHAVQTLHHAHINPQALADFFAVMLKEQSEEKSTHNSALRNVWEKFSTHPDLQKRIESVQAQTRALPKTTYKHLDIGWVDVQKALKEP
jgi:predicted Zn-dependent protease